MARDFGVDTAAAVAIERSLIELAVILGLFAVRLDAGPVESAVETAGDGEDGVANGFSVETMHGVVGEKAVERILLLRFFLQVRRRRAGLLKGIRQDQEANLLLDGPALFDEAGGEVIEQFGIGGRLADGAEVIGSRDDSLPEQMQPDAVCHDARGERIGGAGNEIGDLEAAAAVGFDAVRRSGDQFEEAAGDQASWTGGVARGENREVVAGIEIGQAFEGLRRVDAGLGEMVLAEECLQTRGQIVGVCEEAIFEEPLEPAGIVVRGLSRGPAPEGFGDCRRVAGGQRFGSVRRRSGEEPVHVGELFFGRLIHVMHEGAGDAEVRVGRFDLLRRGFEAARAIGDARVVRFGDEFEIEGQRGLVVAVGDFQPAE